MASGPYSVAGELVSRDAEGPVGINNHVKAAVRVRIRHAAHETRIAPPVLLALPHPPPTVVLTDR